MSPKGRRIRHDYEVAFIEVVLEEKQQKIEKKDAAPKKVEAKKVDVAKPVVKADMKAAVKTEVKAAAPPKKVEAAPQKSV